MTPKEPVSCSVKEAALYLGVPLKTLYHWLEARLLEHSKIGRKILIDYSELDIFRQRFRIPRQSESVEVN